MPPVVVVVVPPMLLLLLFLPSTMVGLVGGDPARPSDMEKEAAAIGLVAQGRAVMRCCRDQQDSPAPAAMGLAPAPLPVVVPRADDEVGVDDDAGDDVVCFSSDECHSPALFCLSFSDDLDQSGTCSPRIPRGGACLHDDYCKAGLVCTSPSFVCRDEKNLSPVGGFCSEDDDCRGSAGRGGEWNAVKCDLDSGTCVNRDDAALRKAAASAPSSSVASASCGTVERAECYDNCNPATRRDVLRCSFCCLDCEASKSCAKALGNAHVTGPLFRPYNK